MNPSRGMNAVPKLILTGLVLLAAGLSVSSCGMQRRFEGSWRKEGVGTVQVHSDGKVGGEFLTLIGKQEQKSEAPVGGMTQGKYPYSGDLGPFTVTTAEGSYAVAKEHVSATPAYMEPLEVRRAGGTTSTMMGYYATQAIAASWRARNPDLAEVYVPGKDERTGREAEIILFELRPQRDRLELKPVHWFPGCAGSYARVGHSGSFPRK